jgi:hypothetical protein
MPREIVLDTNVHQAGECDGLTDRVHVDQTRVGFRRHLDTPTIEAFINITGKIRQSIVDRETL